MRNDDLYFASFNPHIATIDLHGVDTIPTALEQLEKELFFFFQKGEKYCRIIYGIGTGKLASAVKNALQKNPMIKDFQEEESGGSCIVSV